MSDMNRQEMELLAELSDPDTAVVETLSQLQGDIIFITEQGQSGHSIALMAKRAFEEADKTNRVIVAAHHFEEADQLEIQADGIVAIQCDLTQVDALRELPDAAYVVYMVDGIFPLIIPPVKTTQESIRAAGMACLLNVHTPALVATRYADSCIVVLTNSETAIRKFVLSTPDADNNAEQDTDANNTQPFNALTDEIPICEYDQAARSRESVFSYYAQTHGTPITLLRASSINEPRRGVLVDIATSILNQVPIDLAVSPIAPLWATDFHRIALRSFANCNSPATKFNVTGPQLLSLHNAAEQLADALGQSPLYVNEPHPVTQSSIEAFDSNEHVLPSSEITDEPEFHKEFMINRISSWLLEGNPVWSPTDLDDKLNEHPDQAAQ
jgi:hypothetical protein